MVVLQYPRGTTTTVPANTTTAQVFTDTIQGEVTEVRWFAERDCTITIEADGVQLAFSGGRESGSLPLGRPVRHQVRVSMTNSATVARTCRAWVEVRPEVPP